MSPTGKTLRFAVRKYGPFESALQKTWDAWRAETGSDMDLEAVPMELHELHDTVLSKDGLKTGDWDIAHLCTDWIAEAALKDAAENLQPYIERHPPQDYPAGWTASLLELQRQGDQLLGLPFHDGPECLIYRRDLFEDPRRSAAYRQRFGTELRVPETWDEFCRVARFFNEPDKGLYGAVLAGYPDGHNAVFDFCLQVWSRGGSLLDERGELDINTVAARTGLQFYRELMADEKAIHPGSPDFESVRAGAAFAAGEAAMTVNWFGFAAACQQEGSAVKGLVDVAPIPRGEGGKTVSLNVYWLYVIGTGSKRKAEAYDFIRFATGKTSDKLLTIEGGIGCRSSTWEDAEVNQLIPYCHRLKELHANARTLPALPEWPVVAGIIDSCVQEALGSDKAIEEILKEGQVKIDRI